MQDETRELCKNAHLRGAQEWNKILEMGKFMMTVKIISLDVRWEQANLF